MPSYNKVILMGHTTRDVEMRFTSSGKAVGKFGLALNRKWKGEDGQERQEVTFVDIDCFGRQAETLAQYTKKGALLLVEGRLKTDTWDDKQSGQKRSKLGMVLESFQFGPKEEPAKPQSNASPAPKDDVPY